jgi:hypothetical protein
MIFGCPQWIQVAQVAFRAETALDRVSDVCVGLVEEHPYLCASSVSGDSSLRHFGKEDSRPCGSVES